ncbi:uncharacterized protein [Drosophila takahashii]|uniref:uncharacterized protein n=1 Tax=Drosophila takahashii TaxID=29030 RepID=UPI0038996520
MSFTLAPAKKRFRSNTNNNVSPTESMSDAPPPWLLEMLNSRFKEQTEQIASYVRDAEVRIVDGLTSRLDCIAAEMKQFGELVTIVEGEVAQLRAGRNQLIKRVKHLDREVGELTTLRERVGEIEAKLAAQQMAN